MPDMTMITVTKDRKKMAVYHHPIPEAWIKSMKKAGYRVTMKEGAKSG